MDRLLAKEVTTVAVCAGLLLWLSGPWALAANFFVVSLFLFGNMYVVPLLDKAELGSSRSDTLRDSRAVVCDATVGIGPSLVRDLAQRGVHLALVSENSSQLDQLAEEALALGAPTVRPIRAHAGSFAASKDVLWRSSVALGGRLDVLVVNLSWPMEVGTGKHESSDVAVERIFANHCFSAINLCSQALPLLSASNGRALLVCSPGERVAKSSAPSYSSCAAALNAWVNSTRLTWTNVSLTIGHAYPLEPDTRVAASFVCGLSARRSDVWVSSVNAVFLRIAEVLPAIASRMSHSVAL